MIHKWENDTQMSGLILWQNCLFYERKIDIIICQSSLFSSDKALKCINYIEFHGKKYTGGTINKTTNVSLLFFVKYILVEKTSEGRHGMEVGDIRVGKIGNRTHEHKHIIYELFNWIPRRLSFPNCQEDLKRILSERFFSVSN